MARIRTIKPEFWSSEQVMDCSPMARLLFIGLWNFCDDGGNHVASPRTVKANVFPGDDITSTDIQRYLDELSSNGLIAFYLHENKAYLHVTGWHHQKIERPTYKHPPYKSPEIEGKSEPPRRTFDDQSPPEGKGREGISHAHTRERETTEPPAGGYGDPRPAGELAKVLRSLGVQVTPANPDFKGWVDAGLTADEATAGVDIARNTKPAPEPIPWQYLAKVLATQRNAAKAGAPQKVDAEPAWEGDV